MPFGYKHTPERIEKIRLSKLGKKRKPFSKEWREKLRLVSLGNKSRTGQKRSVIELKRLSQSVSGTNNPNYRGENVGYQTKHTWLRKEFGRASKCENCKTEKLVRFEWANISKKYKRQRTDYIQLCALCHRRWDNGIIEIKLTSNN